MKKVWAALMYPHNYILDIEFSMPENLTDVSILSRCHIFGTIFPHWNGKIWGWPHAWTNAPLWTTPASVRSPTVTALKLPSINVRAFTMRLSAAIHDRVIHKPGSLGKFEEICASSRKWGYFCFDSGRFDGCTLTYTGFSVARHESLLQFPSCCSFRSI